MSSKALRVSEFLQHINDLLREVFPPRAFIIEGEISDYRISHGKWVNFSLKDEEENALLPCFTTTWQLSVPLEEGMRVQVVGYPRIYPRFGKFSLNVEEVTPVGEGAIRQAYEQLKKKLETEGLFDGSRKRSIPRFPERIGLITSAEAAAFGDFMRILNNRWAGVDVRHAPVHVQGREAVDEIVGAITQMNALPEKARPDVIVLTRGGGSLEDLHAFNDERTTRAVFQSQIPVICGVGHERDESLCDFVADVRASTPSNAAERVVPSKTEVLHEIKTMQHFLEDHIGARVEEGRALIDRMVASSGFVLKRERERQERLEHALHEQVEGWHTNWKDRVTQQTALLTQVDPQRVLARGYGIVRHEGGVVTDADTLAEGACVNVQLANGAFDAKVDRKKKQKQETLI